MRQQQQIDFYNGSGTAFLRCFALWSLLQCSFGPMILGKNTVHAQETSNEQAVEIVRITKLFLVNTKTEKDIMELKNNSEYDLLKVGMNLTIRAETTDKNGCGWVAFNLDDGALQHTDLNDPFTLAGNDTDGSLFQSTLITKIGTHTLKVTPSVDGGLMEIPVEQLNLPVLTDRPTSFKSCWKIKEFESTPAVPKEEVPSGDALDVSTNTSTTTKVEATSSPSLSSILGSLSSLLSGRGRRELGSISSISSSSITTTVVDDETTVRRRRKVQEGIALAASDGGTPIVDDGSMSITFTVRYGLRPLPSTQPPKPVTDVPQVVATSYGSISGSFFLWDKITFGFQGPFVSEVATSERAPSGPAQTFRDYRVEVTMVHLDGTGTVVVVPGYYAADGNAANTHASTGSVWVAHFVPKHPGKWQWTVAFKIGENCAPNNGCDSAGAFDGNSGTFTVEEPTADVLATMDAKDLRLKGKLTYVGTNHLQYAGTGEFFLKMGPDSPENLLAYNDFDVDGTPTNGKLIKTYSAHEIHYEEGNPTWSGGKGVGLIGAINYLSSMGMNVVSATTLTANGPDKNVYPISNPNESKSVFDTSKLAQWGAVFDWTERKGMALKLKLQDSFSDDFFDEGLTYFGEERKLFYREMIARYGHHLGMIWDLGEDMTDIIAIKERCDYIRSIDPYSSPIMVHTMADSEDSVYTQLLGHPTIDIVSVNGYDIASKTKSWIQKSNAALKPWVITSDELTSTTSIWKNVMNGGSGSQFFFGTNDMTVQDFATYESIFTEASYLLKFFSEKKIPIGTMTSTMSQDGITPIGSDIAKVYVVYKERRISTEIVISLPDGEYTVQWYNPRSGVDVPGSVQTITGVAGSAVQLGKPTTSDLDYITLDWIVYVNCTTGCSL